MFALQSFLMLSSSRRQRPGDSRIYWAAMPVVKISPVLTCACVLVQFTDAGEFEDAASEYDDATSRLGSMSMSSMYASDDESTSPPGWQTGSPGFHSVGVGTWHYFDTLTDSLPSSLPTDASVSCLPSQECIPIMLPVLIWSGLQLYMDGCSLSDCRPSILQLSNLSSTLLMDCAAGSFGALLIL